MKHALLTLWFVAVPVQASAATRVSSDSDCPSADAISQRLLGLLVAAGPQVAAAHVRVDGETMRIELAVPGEANRERVVSASGDCDQRAEMAALVIAAWLDAMPAGTLSAPGLPPREPPRVAPPASPEDVGDDEDAEHPPFALGTRTLLGAGLFGMADSQGGSGGLALEAAMPNLLVDFGWVAEVSMAWPREMTVGQGRARCFRPTFQLAVTGDIALGNWAVRPRAGAALGVLAVSGSGYETNRSGTTVTWGGGAGLTLARSWRHGEIWARVEGLSWPQGRKVKSRQVGSVSVGADLEEALPAWEGRLAAGVSWGVR